MSALPRYRLGDFPEPLDAPLRAALAQVETSTVGHGIPWGLMRRDLRPVAPGLRLVGTAVTLAIPGADSTLLHHALSLLRPGDALVIDRLGDRDHACLGGIVAAAIQRTGAAGVILDGPCTDLEQLQASGLPVWCGGTSSVTTRLLDWGGRLNHPVSCGGVVVQPGDAVVADADGVLVLPRQEAAEIARAALALQARADTLLDAVRAGQALGVHSGASALVMAGAGPTR
ncbi:RraA family protein [Pseudoxanthomonas winnipegensis]|uniref:Putative 4-hydroxy-4-methyl-2-oxoglutarate aldolase n=1 Tax=Pseudoxanthomonas winnipegensis TaxID=2480810 RepID=A0A4Q8LS66_9GAMM|nr:RraA family protein [Pseudoxanthomonas winnipegensis]RZZ88291.1 RraA family protein [Pseudoxanthomonas winnipegensis]TAA32781.1 RraA family protein [Pseudoxanthomonas winnipegensis]TAA34577.1 RraA family protein [Pseudoxanthomonas winnipegensis]